MGTRHTDKRMEKSRIICRMYEEKLAKLRNYKHFKPIMDANMSHDKSLIV